MDWCVDEWTDGWTDGYREGLGLRGLGEFTNVMYVLGQTKEWWVWGLKLTVPVGEGWCGHRVRGKFAIWELSKRI